MASVGYRPPNPAEGRTELDRRQEMHELMQRAGPAWAWDAYKLSEPLILRQWYPELRLGPAAWTRDPPTPVWRWRDVA